ncbi:FtsX-like permease family protein [Streptococcus thoraltensis]|uniref:FtsX-like permease family protein n=1 Tax=Streptococcus thoraltensis TaxID=55085 RepID=UPI00037C0DC7|nr:FtsX-like permease family protein [Streptococcus thoraltensis]MDY4762330.1 FtsX-like permease family protein [Streptococcus thoraltensis]
MSKKTYWKDIWKSLGSSKGRFLSIMLLMMLGSFAYVGLKVTTPDMQRSATNYLNRQNTMDLTVIASMGLGKEDQKELQNLKKADVDFGYMADVTIKDTNDALRVMSTTDRISKMTLVKGELPSHSKEIALASNLNKRYQIGDTINFTQSDDGILKQTSFKVTGFVNSPEIWSTTNLGSSTAGDGNLSAYGMVVADAFDSDYPLLARIRYHDLAKLSSFEKTYQSKLRDKQDSLDKLLADNPENHLAEIKKEPQAEIDDNKQKLADASQKITDGETKIADAKRTLSDQEKALAALPQVQAEAATAQIREAKKEVAQQEKDLAAAKKDLATKEKNLVKAQEDLNALAMPSYTVYTRETLPGGNGYMVYASGSDSVAQIGNIFPVVLYLVAALVTFTTMTRFVDEERTNSAILKALGYSNADVIRKFVIYGLIASLTGTILGVLAGHYILPRVIADIMTKDTTISAVQYDFFWSYTFIAIGLALVSAVLPAYLIARRELSEKAAQLLLPKPPVKGSKILLERLSLIWEKMSFTQKVTARNIFRYKQRMLMTIFGVAGSVALLFAGLGIQSSLSKVVDNQFDRLTPYDMLVVEASDAKKEDKDKLIKALSSDEVAKQMTIDYASMIVEVPKMTQHQSVSLLISEQKDFGSFVNLYDAKSGEERDLAKDGVLISEKLAKAYQVKEGQRIRLKDDKGQSYKAKVSGIIEMNAGHYLMMTKPVFEKTFKKVDASEAHLVNLKDKSSQALKNQATALLRLVAVSGLSQNSAMVDTVEAVVASLNGAMTILTVVAVLLAVVILYNLTNINVAERIRELSTIKVLGFFNKEVTMYIYRETIILSLIGIGVGLLTGIYLHKFIMSMIGGNDILFGTQVTWTVYAIPIAVILIILILLGWLVNYILKTVDMLEALKSVD